MIITKEREEKRELKVEAPTMLAPEVSHVLEEKPVQFKARNLLLFMVFTGSFFTAVAL